MFMVEWHQEEGAKTRARHAKKATQTTIKSKREGGKKALALPEQTIARARWRIEWQGSG